MATPFIAEIVMFAGNFAPRGWAFCNGQLVPIAQNTALFSLIGTTYGGDGRTNFALPDLRGRTPVHAGQGPGLPMVSLGESGGEPNHTLTVNEMPGHSHSAQGVINVSSGAGNNTSPSNNFLAASGSRDVQYAPSADATMNAGASQVVVGAAGGSQPHNNMQPYLGVNFIIALEGIFPSRS